MSGGHAVEAWMLRHARDQLVVLSPHLDDAVFSAFSALVLPFPREVVTAVTAGQPGVATSWSMLTGFADSATEHAARREEDRAVLEGLGVVARHLGGLTGDRASMTACIADFIDAQSARMDRVAWLLPAGAGRRQSLVQRLSRRLLRTPAREGAHPEHVHVRDVAVARLSTFPAARWAFYAELPYAWQEPAGRLPDRVACPAGRRATIFSESPDARSKCRAAAGYRSQAAIALGRDGSSQEAFCSRPEWFLLD